MSVHERTRGEASLALGMTDGTTSDKAIGSEVDAAGKDEKIGAYAKRMIYSALSENRVPDADFERLLTVEGTKELLGASLTTCPLFSYSRMIRRDGRNGCWTNPVVRDGKEVFVNSQWYESHRRKLDRLLSRWKDRKDDDAGARVGARMTDARDESDRPAGQLAELLGAEFANGIRPESIIDRNKLRRLFVSRFGESLPDDLDVGPLLRKVGIVHDGKVFPRPSSAEGGWRQLVDGLVGEGNAVFQFSCLMERHAAALMQAGITSADMLREVVRRDAGAAFDVSGDFFAPHADEPIEARLQAAILPDESSVVDVKDAAGRLPYVAAATIQKICSEADGLIRNGAGTYAVTTRILFDDDEVSRGTSCCETAIGRDGFFSLSQLALADSASLNDRRLSDGALRRAFYARFLSDGRELHGQVVCACGANLDGQASVRAFCRGRSDVTLSEAKAIARESRIADYLALQTLYDEMVRVDAERFVAPSLVCFDVSATDACLGDLATGPATPFGTFCRFAGFPAVPGYVWNDCLLESYLRRASVRFRLLKPGVVSSEPAGVVVSAASLASQLSRHDDRGGERAIAAFARAAASAGISPDPDAVGDFLCASRCILRRTKPVITATVAAMCAKEGN